MTWPNSHFPCEEKEGVRPPQSLPGRGHSSGQIHQAAGQKTSPQQRLSISSRAKRFPRPLGAANQKGKPSARPAPFPSSLSFPSRVEGGPESCVTAKAQDLLTRVSAPLRASSCLILHRAAAATAATMDSTPDSHEMNGLTTAMGNGDGNGNATPPEEVRASLFLSRRAGQEDKSCRDRALLLGWKLGEDAPGAWDSSAGAAEAYVSQGPGFPGRDNLWQRPPLGGGNSEGMRGRFPRFFSARRFPVNRVSLWNSSKGEVGSSI